MTLHFSFRNSSLRQTGLHLAVAVGLMMMSAAVQAETVALVGSDGRVEYVDTQNPGRHAWPAEAPKEQVKAGITFNVVYNDVVHATQYGFDARGSDPVYGTIGAARRAIFTSVLDYLGTVLRENGTCDVLVQDSEHGTSGPLAFAQTYFRGFPPVFTNGDGFTHITTGSDPNASTADIEVTVFFDWSWYVGTGMPTFSQVDFSSVILHELTHGVGFLSLSTASGQSGAYPGIMAVYDKFLVTGNAKKLWNNTTAAFQGVPSDLTGGDNGIVFTGPNAIAAFGGSQPPIYTPSPWQDGSSLSHWNTGGKIAGNAVMEPVFTNGEVIRQYAPVDAGALKDLGYTHIGETSFAFTTLPHGGWYEEGMPLTLRVAVTGTTGTVTYQWKKDTVDLPGETGAQFSIASLTLGDSGAYTVVVTDESKAVHESPPAYVTVVEAGSLPAAGMAALCLTAAACLLVEIRALRRRK